MIKSLLNTHLTKKKKMFHVFHTAEIQKHFVIRVFDVIFPQYPAHPPAPSHKLQVHRSKVKNKRKKNHMKANHK